jgi:hypothetical protein
MTFVGENLPSADNRVVLSKQKDRYGFPLARVTHDYGTDDLTCFDTGMAQGRAIFKAAGAYEVWVSGRATMYIMGRTAHASVTNSYGQAHEIAHIPPDLVVRGITAHRKPPEVRICRLRNQSAVGTRPPSTSTPHWPACWARR